MDILGRWARTRGIVLLVAAVVFLAPAVQAAQLFSPQANQLDVYDLSEEPPRRRDFIPSAAAGGRDLNGQVCFFPDKKHVLLGDDTGQTKGAPQGWGIIEIRSRRQVGKLIADYGSTKLPDNYGCAIETDVDANVKRIFVSQLGAGNFLTPDGQLIVFFPSSHSLDAVFRIGTQSCAGDDCVCPGGDCSGLTKNDSEWCILDNDLRTASGMAMDAQGNLYVAEQAPSPLPGRVLRYSASELPDSQADCPGERKILQPETFIRDFRAATPSAIVAARGPDGKHTGNWYVSSVFLPAVVNEYDSRGNFVRRIVPRGHGNPFGLAVGPDGTLYFADLGISFKLSRLRADPARLGFSFGAGEGSVQRVRFSRGAPLPPEVLADELDYPDGLGLLE